MCAKSQTTNKHTNFLRWMRRTAPVRKDGYLMEPAVINFLEKTRMTIRYGTGIWWFEIDTLISLMIHNFRKHSLTAKSTASGEPSEKTEKFTMQKELIFYSQKKRFHTWGGLDWVIFHTYKKWKNIKKLFFICISSHFRPCFI